MCSIFSNRYSYYFWYSDAVCFFFTVSILAECYAASSTVQQHWYMWIYLYLCAYIAHVQHVMYAMAGCCVLFILVVMVHLGNETKNWKRQTCIKYKICIKVWCIALPLDVRSIYLSCFCCCCCLKPCFFAERIWFEQRNLMPNGTQIKMAGTMRLSLLPVGAFYFQIIYWKEKAENSKKGTNLWILLSKRNGKKSSFQYKSVENVIQIESEIHFDDCHKTSNEL